MNRFLKVFLIFLIVLGFLFFLIFVLNGFRISPEPVVEKISLTKILELEIRKGHYGFFQEDWVCLDYMLYYNETLSQYPELDVRPIRYFDICNNYTLCNYSHTFIVVGGYGSECILEKDKFICLTLR